MNALLPIHHDHPAFTGHFPGDPIVPGVVLLDEMLHAIGLQLKTDVSACVIKVMKFLSPVRPGETVSVDFVLADNGLVRFTLHSDDRKVAIGAFNLPAIP